MDYRETKVRTRTFQHSREEMMMVTEMEKRGQFWKIFKSKK